MSSLPSTEGQATSNQQLRPRPAPIKFIGLTGRAGAGKSTVAKALEDKLTSLSYSPTILPMAGALKHLAAQLGWAGQKDPPGRKLLQDLGQTLREYDPLHWINAWDDQRRLIPNAPNRVIIVDDVRHTNEFEHLSHSLRGTMIHVVTDRPIEGVREHISERGINTDLCRPDAVLVNNGTEADLYTEASTNTTLWRRILWTHTRQHT